MNWLKSLFSPRSPLELATAELLDAERSLLSAESASEYAESMSLYHRTRIERLRAYISEIVQEQV